MLTPDEQAELEAVFPRAAGVKQVSIGRMYGGDSRWVGYDLPEIPFKPSDVRSKTAKIMASISVATEQLEEPQSAPLQSAAADFEGAIAPSANKEVWAAGAIPALAALRQAIARANANHSPKSGGGNIYPTRGVGPYDRWRQERPRKGERVGRRTSSGIHPDFDGIRTSLITLIARQTISKLQPIRISRSYVRLPASIPQC
jgi:hypothetical protein